MKYKIFTRTWYRKNPRYPNRLEPHMGRRTIIAYANSAEEARRICEAWNNNNPAGKYSRKAEYTTV